jgi:hypothetical protein
VCGWPAINEFFMTDAPRGPPAAIEYTVPIWMVAAVLAASLVAALRRVRRRKSLRARNLCPSCGYDLRATRDGCPECGASAATRA